MYFMQVLQEEIKHTGFINGGPGIYGVGSKVKVDQKALEEVYTCSNVHVCYLYLLASPKY